MKFYHVGFCAINIEQIVSVYPSETHINGMLEHGTTIRTADKDTHFTLKPVETVVKELEALHS